MTQFQGQRLQPRYDQPGETPSPDLTPRAETPGETEGWTPTTDPSGPAGHQSGRTGGTAVSPLSDPSDTDWQTPWTSLRPQVFTPDTRMSLGTRGPGGRVRVGAPFILGQVDVVWGGVVDGGRSHPGPRRRKIGEELEGCDWNPVTRGLPQTDVQGNPCKGNPTVGRGRLRGPGPKSAKPET